MRPSHGYSSGVCDPDGRTDGKTMIGIDPGLDGAIAFLDSAGGIVSIKDMPTVTVMRGKKQKRELDLYNLAALLRRIGDRQATVERVGAMPGQGVTSMFSFGQTYGGILGVLAALGIAVSHVQPAVWRKTMCVRGGKDASRLRASELWPDAVGLWPLKKHDGRAEAVLIAAYGRLAFNSILKGKK
jgi:crossover junction endodeoxyribonuclease RuvC